MAVLIASKQQCQKLAGIIAIVVALAATLAYISYFGHKGRVFAKGHVIYTVAHAEEAVQLWDRLGVRGRTLIYLDSRIPLETVPHEDVSSIISSHYNAAGLNRRNFLYVALHGNIIRRIYFVIPDRSWGQTKERLQKNPGAVRQDSQFRITVEGSPIVITRLQDIFPLREKVLIFMGEGEAGQYDGEAVQRITNDTSLADIIVVSRDEADAQEQRASGP